jgi:hypothetical protein
MSLRAFLSTRVIIAISICVVLALYLSVRATLNMSEYCTAKKRVLSDREFIDAAVTYELKYHERGDEGPVKRYESIDEFHKVNDRCCGVKRDVLDEFPPFGRLFWSHVVGVYISYQISDAAPNKFYSATVWLSVCAEPGEHWGHRTSNQQPWTD